MYLARLATDDQAIIQGMVSLPGLPSVPADLDAIWRDTFKRLVNNLYAVDPVGAALRVILHRRAGATGALLVAADERDSAQLRRFLAPFTRLETIAPGSAQLPLTRSEYDAVADDFPSLRCRVGVAGYASGGAWFACDFSIGPSLDSIMAEAETYGYRLGYQVNVSRLDVDAYKLRQARLNALKVSELAGVPQAASSLQLELSRRLGQAVAAYEEYVGVDSADSARWLQTALARRFRERFGPLRFETPEWSFSSDEFEDELACPALLDPRAMSATEICSTAISESEVTSFLSWVPPQSLIVGPGGPYEPEPEEEVVLPHVVELPPQADTDKPFLFISYRRSDLKRVLPIVRELQQQGWRIWYDAGIPGGADWNAMLEERLESCSGVLLFLSQAAIDSKWVRREIRFADSLDKPIIGIQLEAAELRHGMRLLLEHYQLLSQDARDFLDELNRSLTLIVPVSPEGNQPS